METAVCNGPLCKGVRVELINFGKNNTQCRKCLCERQKQYYKENGRGYRTYKNSVKEKNPCTVCGCNDIRLLEFDHINTKNIKISKSFSQEKIEKELEYTQILCIWCHRLKSREQMDETKKKTDEKFNITERPVDLIKGKECNGELCKGELQFIENFYTKGTKCKACHAYRARKFKDANNNFIKNLKLQLKECELCKIQVTEDTVTCFDFDHLRDKVINISILAKLTKDTREQIKEESKKCRLLCCRCHKLHTIEQLGFHYEKTASELPENPLR